MSVVAYVSGHGFGHSVREVEILRCLPLHIPLVVKTAAPEWFWRQQVARPFEYVGDAFDVGCLQTTSLEVDPAATLAAWLEVDRRNAARADAELRDLERRGARVVLTDVPSFPLTLATRAGIPGLCVANFTWKDIYADLIEAEAGFASVAEQMRSEYAQATLLLEAGLSLPMDYFPRRESIGLVARPSTPRRDILVREMNLDPAKKLALVYVGNWGLPLPWERLETFREWQFLSFHEPPAPVKNLYTLSQDLLPHADVVASVDLVISKAGYGLVGECLTARTPLLYCPREGFAEHAALHRALSQWEGGICLAADAFLGADWMPALERVPARAALPEIAAPGGEKAIKIVTSYHDGGGYTYAL